MRQGDTVAVVDDDAAVRESLSCLLAAHGFGVATFDSAEHFLQQADPCTTGCLLLDVQMPTVSGLDLLRRLGNRFPHLPVAVMTGSPSSGLAAQARALGANEVMEKPLAMPELLHFVEAATA